MNSALIFGLGQDSSYLSEFLIEKEYKVIAVKRRTSSTSMWRFNKILNNPNFTIIEGDVTDFSSCLNIIQSINPDEIYNLAAQSHVGTSFSQPLYTWDATAKGVFNILEVMKFLKSKAKLYQASSSEMFGNTWSVNCGEYNAQKDFVGKPSQTYERFYRFQNENTKFCPKSPYAIAKLAAHNAVNLYRDAYGIWAVGGILFNHDSPRRGIGFVTRKITNHFHKLKRLTDEKLQLGNLDAYRDWGYAKEFVEAIWLMLQQSNPKDYVIGTGQTYSVRDFLQEVINYYDFDMSIEDLCIINDNLKRPVEVPYLRADASLVEKELGWKAKTSFKELVELMVEQENDLP